MKEDIKMEYCDECGTEYPSDVMEGCMNCFGQFCPSCIDEHEEECGLPKCAACAEAIDEDPICPICKNNFCEDCLEEHFPKCKQESELGKQQRLLTEYFL